MLPWNEEDKHKHQNVFHIGDFPRDDHVLRTFYDHRHKESDTFQGLIHLKTTIPPDEFIKLM